MQRSRCAAPLFIAAAASYGANAALGTAVAARVIDTSNFRWLHHALYLTTSVLTAAALGSTVFTKPKSRERRAASALAPVVVPLAVIPYLGSRGWRHPLVALSAAPFYAAALVRLRVPPTRARRGEEKHGIY